MFEWQSVRGLLSCQKHAGANMSEQCKRINYTAMFKRVMFQKRVRDKQERESVEPYFIHKAKNKCIKASLDAIVMKDFAFLDG